MATYLTVVLLIVYTLITMGVTIQDTKSLKSVWIKTNEQQLFHQLEEEYCFSKAICRSLVHLMNEFIEENYGNLRSDTQIIYHAVHKDEPPGKSLKDLKLVPVKLTVSTPEDAHVLSTDGIQGLRQHKLIRLSNEAYEQNGLLIQQDLAHLLTTSTRTIQRDMKELRDKGIMIPTRGSLQDIGPTLSHKAKIIELYLKGYEYTEIEQRTHHTGDAIKRYILGFSKVILLSQKGYNSVQIRELTSQSEKVVAEYLDLFNQYMDIAHERLLQILGEPPDKIPCNEPEKRGKPI